MAVNFLYSGRRITLTPSTPVAAGVWTRIQGFFGIPLNNRVAGQSVAFAIEGVWGMTWSYQAADVGVGTILYWNVTAAALSIGYANDGFPVMKAVSAPDANGYFQALLLKSEKPVGQTQA